MYFVGLTRLKDIPKPLLSELDAFLTKRYATMSYFTPKTIARELHISEDLAFDLFFAVREMGLFLQITVQTCQVCQNKQRIKDKQCIPCPQCGETDQMKIGYLWLIKG